MIPPTARVPRLAALIFVSAPLLAAAGAAQAADPDRGRALAARWCVSCHVVAPDTPGADAGPAFETLGDRTEDQLRLWIADPHPPMPDMQISGPDIDDIVAHIRAVSG